MHSNDPERLETLATPIELSNHHTTNERPPKAYAQPHSNNPDERPDTSSGPISLRELLRTARTGETLCLQLEHPTTGETTLTATVNRVNRQQDKTTLTDPDSAGQRFTIAFEGPSAELYRACTPISSNSDDETTNTATPQTHVGTIVAAHNLASYPR